MAVVLCIMLAMSACAKKNDSFTGGTSYDTASSNANEVAIAQTDQTKTGSSDRASGSDTAAAGKNTDTVSNSSSLTESTLKAQSNDKIIKRYNLKVETRDFDKLIQKLNDKINSLGGYVENSSISGRSLYDSASSRQGNIVARIPSSKTDEFVNTVSDSANVVNNTCETENVTLQYIDTQSRIDTLKIEQERLYALLEKSKDLDSIITLESRLSEIRYELQNYESQKRSYDNEVQYSTVTLNIQEVERITPVSDKKPSLAERISTGFSNTLYHISEAFQNFLVWFIVTLPYLLIWGLIILAAVIITRRLLRRSDKKINTSLHTVPVQKTVPQGQMPQEAELDHQGQNNNDEDTKPQD